MQQTLIEQRRREFASRREEIRRQDSQGLSPPLKPLIFVENRPMRGRPFLVLGTFVLAASFLVRGQREARPNTKLHDIQVKAEAEPGQAPAPAAQGESPTRWRPSPRWQSRRLWSS